jgi:hypothetical protein
MGLLKIIGLVLIYTLVATFFFIIFAKEYIANNWGTYKCQPHIIPFASLFGYDTSENFNKCMYQQSSSNNKVFMSPMFNITGLMSGIMGDLSQSVNSLRESNSQTRDLLGTITGGFVNRISDLSSTLQYLFIKIRTLVERLFGVFTVLIYTSLTTVELMTSVVNGPIGSMMSVFCFSGNVKVNMVHLKQVKKISCLTLDDKVNLGGDIVSMMKFKTNNKLFKYKNNTAVSGGHLVYNNESNNDKSIWQRVENTNYIKHNDQQFNPENNEVYCITTKNNLIEINDNIFRDYIETSNDTINTHIKNSIVKQLNNETYKDEQFIENNTQQIKKSKMNNYYVSGFAKNTKIKLLSGNFVEIYKLKLDDTLHDGSKIIGTIVHKNNDKSFKTDMCILNDVIVHKDTIVYYKKKWIIVKDIPHIIQYDYYEPVYNIVNTNNLISINGCIFRDFTETNNDEINNYIDATIDTYLNKPL